MLTSLTNWTFTPARSASSHNELRDDVESTMFLPDEFLADTFAGFLLLPAQGVKRASSGTTSQFSW